MSPLTNGAREALIEATLSGGREKVDRFLVESALQNRESLEAIPDAIASAIAAHRTECAQSRGRVWRVLPNWALVAISFGSLLTALLAVILHG